MTSPRHANQGLPEFHLHNAQGAGGRDRIVRFARIAALLALVLLLVGLARVVVVRNANGEALARRAAASAVLNVRVVTPKAGGQDARLSLPATLQGIHEAQIYARVNGYVKRWIKDIGDPVERGDTLAVLDIPEIDKQVEEAEANFELAKTAYERWSRLRERDAVSQQEYDEKSAAYRQTAAILKRLREQQGFAVVSAPFDGIVTRRNVDHGALVNAGNGGSAQALFALANTDRLRLYVYVPEERASRVRLGDEVTLQRSDAPKQSIKGRITRTAGAIDPALRTLQVEIQVANTDHALLPGAYVNVTLSLAHDAGVKVPTNTLLFGAEGARVATVQADSRVRLKPVEVGVDYGPEVEIRAGLTADDRVIVNPPDSIGDGQTVTVAADARKDD